MIFCINSILLGPTGIGKTSLLSKYYDPNSNISENRPTMGLELRSKSYKSYSIRIIDASGKKIYRSIITQYYRGNNLVFFCFSLENKNTLYELQEIIDEFTYQVGVEPVRILVGTCFDLQKSNFDSEIKKFQINNLMDNYFEISSKNNLNIQDLFDFAFKHVINLHESKQIKLVEYHPVKKNIEKKPLLDKPKKKSCCFPILL